MAQIIARSDQRDEFDVQAREMPLWRILLLSAGAIALAIGLVSALGAILFG